MMNAKVRSLLCCCLLCASLQVLSAQVDPVGDYQSAKRRLPYREQLTFAVRTLQESSNGAVLEAALKDVIEISRRLPDAEAGLEAVERFLAEAERGSKLFQQASLGRARLLLLMGRSDEAMALFQDALRNNFAAPKDGGPIYRYYADSLEHAGHPVSAAIELYNSAVDYGYVDLEKKLPLSMFFGRLFLLRKKNHEASAIRDVLPFLHESAQRPALRGMAEALCLIAHRQCGEAVSLLEEIDSQLAVDLEASPDIPGVLEKREIPLHIAMAQILGGEEPAKVRSSLEEFWSRNRDRPEEAFNLMLAMTYKIEHASNEIRKRMVEVTGFLIDLGFAEDESLRSRLSEEKLAHLLDMHQIALSLCGRWREQKEVCQQIVDQFGLRFPGSVSAMFCLGDILYRREGKAKEAEPIYLQVISQTRHPACVRLAKMRLYTIWRQRGEPAEKILPLIQDLIDSAESELEKEKWQRSAERIRQRENLLTPVEG